MQNKIIDFLTDYKSRLGQNKGHIGIIGVGYVGLPLALAFAENNCNVVGYDIDVIRVQKLNDGYSPINHIHDSRVRDAVNSGYFKCETDFQHIASAHSIVLCLPTPLGPHKEPKLDFIIGAMNTLRPFLHAGQLLSLESTTYPGTTEEIILPLLKECKDLIPGENFFLVYSPEREDPGNVQYSTGTIPKVIGGLTGSCLEAGLSLYGQAIQSLVPVSTLKAAEMTKILENIHRSVNIGLINELKVLAIQMGIDINEVIKAAATKPFGFVPYYPGPGLGGHCIPIDPYYLTWKAREYGLHTRFVELAGEINSAMPQYVITRILLALNESGLPASNSKILILGMAYKKNVDDLRESPSIEITKHLHALGSKVVYSDPYIPNTHIEGIGDLVSTSVTPQVLMSADIVVLLVDHDIFEYNVILKYSSLIVDTRGTFRNNEKVWRA